VTSPSASRAIRISGSVAILGALFLFVPGDSLRTAFASASIQVFAVASLVHFAAHLVAALKWRMLMGQGAGVSIVKAFRAHFSGLVGNLTPLGVVGGDMVRAGVALRGSARPGAVMLTSVVDRVVDTTSLLVLAAIGFVWLGGQSTAAATVLLTGLALFGAGLAACAWSFLWLRRTADPRFAGIREAADVMARQPALVARSLLLSTVVQGAFVSASAYIGNDVGVDCAFAAWLVAWPASKLVSYVPISIAGIGVRETALIALLRPFGADPGAVMAAGLIWQGVFVSGAIAGWLGGTLAPDPASPTQAAPVS
jgi:uncharacterized membrane protein YbhN (UPF0104 family)